MKKFVHLFNVNGEKYAFDGNDFKLFNIQNDSEFEKYCLGEDRKITISYETGKLIKVVLNVSNKCNLRCKYCYAEGGNYGRSEKLMSTDTVDQIIKELKEGGIKKIGILSFFGGEPTLNFSLIEYALPIFKRNFIIDNYEVVTNGTLLDESMINFLGENEVALSVSIDGPEDITDALRGKGTFEKAYRSLKLAKTLEYKNLYASATYTKVHSEMGYSYQDICDFFEKMKVKMTVSQVLTSDPKLKVVSQMTDEEVRKDISRTLSNICENRIKTQINPFVYSVLISVLGNSLNEGYCDDLNEYYTLNYDYNGDKYNCFRFWNNKDYMIGNVGSKELKKCNNKENHILCKSCWAKKICKFCLAAVLQGDSELPVKDQECRNQYIYEIVFEELIKIIQNNQHQILAQNFISNFLVYR